MDEITHRKFYQRSINLRNCLEITDNIIVMTTMEKVILDAINHIKYISKRKLSLDNILQKNNKTSATNLDTEALTSELEKNDI